VALKYGCSVGDWTSNVIKEPYGVSLLETYPKRLGEVLIVSRIWGGIGLLSSVFAWSMVWG